MKNLLRPALASLIVLALFKFGYEHGAGRSAARVQAKPILPPQPKASMGLQSYVQRSKKSTFCLNGVPAQVDAYAARGILAAQKASFSRQWQARGYHTRENKIGRMHILSAVDEQFRLFKCVLLIPGASEQQTIVIPASLDFSKPRLPRRPRVPLYPGAKPLMHLEAQDLAGNSENVIYLSDAAVPAVMNYYQTQLQQRGWRVLQPPNRSFSAQVRNELFLVKGNDEMRIVAEKMTDGNQTFVFQLLVDKL